MKNCCKCKKLVWTWQQSKITNDAIHLKCHKTMMSEFLANNENMRESMGAETKNFERQTGINSGLNVADEMEGGDAQS